MSNLHLIPFDPKQGGSRFGWHFIALYKECPMKWFNRYLRTHPQGGFGAEPKARSTPLQVGSAVHSALEGWYHSGWRNGDYSLSAALDTLNCWQTEECASLEVVAEAVQLMERHHAFCGPGGTSPEWPSYKVASVTHAAGKVEPLIEATLEVPLDYKDYVFTSKVDLIVEHRGLLWPLDHKTSAAARVGAAIRQYDIDGQLTGQLWAMRHRWPEAPLSTDALVNFVIKGAAAAKPPRLMHPTSRSETDLSVFRATTVRTLKRIEDSIEEYNSLVVAGADPNTAALIVFDSYPSGKTCGGEFFPCDYLHACMSRDRMHQIIGADCNPRVSVADALAVSDTGDLQ